VRELRVLYQEAEPPAFITMISDLQPNGPRITRLSQETP
jgi:hypothetical protein